MSNLMYWFTENKKWIFLWFSIFVIVSVSFGFGYLIAKQANPAPIIIEKRSN